MPTNAEQKKGLGCWLYGCLTLVILFFVFAGAAGFAVWKFTTYALEKFTDTAPMTFSAQADSADAEATRNKIGAFSLLLDQQTEPATLTLTQDELNAFLANGGITETGLKAEVELHDNQMSGKISLPLGDMLPFALGEGRYLNGAAALNAFTRDGKLFVFIKSLEVKGQKVPEYLMKELGTMNLAEQRTESESQTPSEFEIAQLQIRDGQLSVSMKKIRK